VTSTPESGPNMMSESPWTDVSGTTRRMRTTRFSETEIVHVVKQLQMRVPVD